MAVFKDVFSKIIFRSLAKVNLSVTHACNYRCKTCKIWRKYLENPELRDQELTLAEYTGLFEANREILWLSLTGGEPFLRDDLTEIVVSALENVDKLRVVNIATNGSLPKRIEKSLSEILDCRRRPVYISVEISLDGKEPIHNEIRGVKDAYQRSLETFRRLRRLKEEGKNELFDVKFEYTMSKYNSGMLKETIDQLAEEERSIGLDDFIITFAHKSFFYDNLEDDVSSETEMTLKEISWFLKNYPKKSFEDRIARSFLKMSIKYFGEDWRPPCVAGEHSCFINPYGDVYPCITMNYPLGNLRTDGFSLREILNNDRSRIFRRKIRDTCVTCWTSCEAYPTIIFKPTEFIRELL
jgi:MoaA/NifB/PqqE/SkfB family radical SAM enzyme